MAQQEGGEGHILETSSMTAIINGTEYHLEGRRLKVDDAIRSEYRILLGETIIKDWTEGDIHQYFNADIYPRS